MKIFIANKLVTASFLAATLLWPIAAMAETITIATEGAYPPFNYVDSNNELQGFDVEIAKALCTKMNVECKLVVQEWEGLVPGLLAKKYDAVVASMEVTPERLDVIDFTKPYYSSTLGIAVHKNSDLQNAEPASLKGHSLGAQINTAAGIFAEDIYKPEGVDVKIYQTTIEYFSDITNQRLDAVMGDTVQVLDWLNHDGKDCCKLLGEVGPNTPMAIALRQNDGDYKARFEKALDDIRADGTYQAISMKYFNKDIY